MKSDFLAGLFIALVVLVWAGKFIVWLVNSTQGLLIVAVLGGLLLASAAIIKYIQERR